MTNSLNHHDNLFNMFCIAYIVKVIFVITVFFLCLLCVSTILVNKNDHNWSRIIKSVIRIREKTAS